MMFLTAASSASFHSSTVEAKSQRFFGVSMFFEVYNRLYLFASACEIMLELYKWKRETELNGIHD